MKYGLFTIDVPGANLGNRMIEYALKRLLKLPEPSVKASMFEKPSIETIERLNKCQFVLLPGSTILGKGKLQGDALEYLGALNVPIFCTAASYWSPNFELNEVALQHITPPIGVRDPLTLIACHSRKVEAVLVGCPTAYLPADDVYVGSYSAVGFARTHVPWQVGLLSRVNKPLLALIQEPTFENPIAKQLKAATVTYDKPEIVIEKLAHANAVYTGRLHSVLPAISQGKPVLFFGDTHDSRFSLLKALGVKVHEIGKDTMLDLTKKEEYKERVEIIKGAFWYWHKCTIQQFE